MKRKMKSYILMTLALLMIGMQSAWAQAHTITLNANSGHFKNEDPSTININEGEVFGHLPTPIRNGFTFAGWYSIPGQEKTRVVPGKTVYHYAVHNEMLHARWTKKKITITFMDYNGKNVIGTVDVSADGGSLMDIDAATFQGTTTSTNTLKIEDNEFFAGYYTRINGEGERIYSGVADQGHLHPVITHESEFTTNVTLYAFHTHVKHTTHWDYTYTDGTDSWINLNQADDVDRIEYGKLTFMDNENNILKWIYFKAAGITNKTTPLTDELNSHTTTKGQFHLQLASSDHAETPNGNIVIGDADTNPDTDGEAGIWNVYFTDEQLSHFTRYNFEPVQTPSTNPTSPNVEVPSTWLRTTDPDAHDTWFTFTGANLKGDNIVELKWTVKLENLKVYPDNVIAKPLFSNTGENDWEEISQLLNLDGVRCAKGETITTGEGTYTEYTGSYPVWKNTPFYAIGMVGFEIYGKTIYMNPETNDINPEQHAGHFNPAFNSANSTVNTDIKTSPKTENFPDIYYTIQNVTIPVVRFMADKEKGEKLSPTTPVILWGTEGETVTNFATTYSATREGYDFQGWSTSPTATSPDDHMGKTDTYTFGGSTTVYPVWKDATAPVITPEKLVACETGVQVTITDNEPLSGVTVTVNGNPQTLDGNGKFTLPVPTEEYKDYVIVATDAAGNSSNVTVRIYKDHNWGEKVATKDPTKTEDGVATEHQHCDQCDSYKDETHPVLDKDDVIIPKGSVLVKDARGGINGGVEYTKAWEPDLNSAIADVNKFIAEGGEKTNYTWIKLTGDTEVTNNVINPTTLPSIVDLNGQGLKVDDGEDNLVDGTIYGNPNVTLLLKDDGETEYTNGSTVTGAVVTAKSPIKYKRDWFAGYNVRANKWQALYLPFAYGSTSSLPYTFGTPESVTITDESASLSITKGVETLAANTHYFVKSSTGTLELNITGVDLLPYEAPTAHEATVSDNYTFRSSLTNGDNVAPETTDYQHKSFWVLTNGGEFYWAKAGAHQRPYHWVIYDETPQPQGAPMKLFLIEEDGPVVTEISTPVEKFQNNDVYTLDGRKVTNTANLKSGLYIIGGKKVAVK